LSEDINKPAGMLKSFLSDFGLGTTMAIAFAMYLIWHNHAQQQEAQKRTDHITAVVQDCNRSSAEMTSAVRSLKESNEKMGSSMKSFEMELMKHSHNHDETTQ